MVSIMSVVIILLPICAVPNNKLPLSNVALGELMG